MAPTSSVQGARQRALWLDQLDPITPRPALDGDLDVDIAILGGGFSGLWTAYYLTELDRSLRIAVLEREYCGFGASGRNGGWAIGELAGSFGAYAARSSAADALRLHRAVFDAVDEIGRVCATEGIDCGYVKGGNIRLARNNPQAERQRAEVREMYSLGFDEDEIRLLDPDEARRYLNATDVRSGIFFAPCSALDPARLVRGLADVVEARGVAIYERTTVRSIDERRVRTDRGVVRADVTVRCLEAYTRDLAGERRTLVPISSLMIATEPLSSEVFDEIGLAGRPTFGDDRHMVVYGQRTDDDRLAFGGRGTPYRYGSSLGPSVEHDASAHEEIHRTLVELAPILADAAITHRWGGVLGIPRDWLPAVRYDRPSGTASLGGYVGEGVAASNLAGRTMADLIADRDTERTTLPWVGIRQRKWEPEPVRWLGVRGSTAILARADETETRTNREARLATRISGLVRGDENTSKLRNVVGLAPSDPTSSNPPTRGTRP